MERKKIRKKFYEFIYLVEQIRWWRGRKLTDRRLKAIKAKRTRVDRCMHIFSSSLVMVIGVRTKKSIIVTRLELVLMRKLCEYSKSVNKYESVNYTHANDKIRNFFASLSPSIYLCIWNSKISDRHNTLHTNRCVSAWHKPLLLQ